MPLSIPTRAELDAILRACVTVCTAAGPMAPVQRRLLDALRDACRASPPLDMLAPIAPGELAAQVTPPALRREAVQGLCALMMTGVPIGDEHLAAIARFAAALGTDDPAVRYLDWLRRGRLRFLRLDFLRRYFPGELLRLPPEDGGLAVDAELDEQPALAARFHALEVHPPGTLGRELWAFYRDRGFPFPGDRGGVPVEIAVHDIMHVLAGYDTSLRGEIEMVALQAGCQREGAMAHILFLLLHAQLGIRLTVAAPPAVGTLEDTTVIGAFMRAYARGTRMRRDLLDGSWDFWVALDRSVAELRIEHGIGMEA